MLNNPQLCTPSCTSNFSQNPNLDSPAGHGITLAPPPPPFPCIKTATNVPIQLEEQNATTCTGPPCNKAKRKSPANTKGKKLKYWKESWQETVLVLGFGPQNPNRKILFSWTNNSVSVLISSMISNQNLYGVDYTTNVSPFLLWRIIERGSVRNCVLRFACAPEDLCLLGLQSVVALGRQICGSSSSYRHNSFPRHLHHRFANSLNHLYGPRRHLCLRSLRFTRNQAAEGKGSAMRRVMVQGLARFSSSSSSSSRYYTHASACLAAAETSTDKSATSGGEAGHVETIIFPREGPGVNYALNWALASKGVTPQGDAYRNLKEKDLKKHNAAIPGSASPAKIYARGSYSVGAADISKAQFNGIFKEVTTHLSSAAKLYVHDGAVGSSPSVDVKVRTISDSSSAALILQRILDPAPTRVVSQDAFPLTVYVASNYSPTDHERLGTVSEGRGGSIVIDYDRSTMILWGSAVNDTESVKMSLAALAAPSVTSRDALPLFSRLLVQGGSTVLLFAPESLVQNNPALLKAAVSPDLGIVWSKDGVARLFATHQPQAANLYKTPSSLVLVTSDSTGAVPDISKVTAEKAAALFIAGYNGEQFHPGYQPGPGSVDPVILAKGLSALLEGSNIPAFLVNASLLSENELVKYIEATVSGKLPKSKVKKPSESAGIGQASNASSSGSKKTE